MRVCAHAASLPQPLPWAATSPVSVCGSASVLELGSFLSYFRFLVLHGHVDPHGGSWIHSLTGSLILRNLVLRMVGLAGSDFSHQVENCPLTPRATQSMSVLLVWTAIFIKTKFPFVLLEPLFLSLICIFSCINTIEINDFTTGKYSFSTTQETTLHMDITKWSIPKSNWLQTDYTAAKDGKGVYGKGVYSRQKQDLELTVAQILSIS